MLPLPLATVAGKLIMLRVRMFLAHLVLLANIKTQIEQQSTNANFALPGRNLKTKDPRAMTAIQANTKSSTMKPQSNASFASKGRLLQLRTPSKLRA